MQVGWSLPGVTLAGLRGGQPHDSAPSARQRAGSIIASASAISVSRQYKALAKASARSASFRLFGRALLETARFPLLSNAARESRDHSSWLYLHDRSPNTGAARAARLGQVQCLFCREA